MISLQVRGEGVFLPISNEELDIGNTLDCGQCFRFEKEPDGSMKGMAGSHYLHLRQEKDGILFCGVTLREVRDFWLPYLDLETEYTPVKQLFSQDSTLRSAITRAVGIRILRQEPLEALVSFLISQNNNIPRIKASIERLCRAYGEPAAENGWYSFPTAQRLAAASPEELRSLGVGYRDVYLLDCAQRVADGRLDLDAVARMDVDSARDALRKLKGVGPKVAECVLLFGFHFLEAFPVDTWMKKVLSGYYPKGLPAEFAPVAGIAQQYLFHAMRRDRTLGGQKNEEKAG